LPDSVAADFIRDRGDLRRLVEERELRPALPEEFGRDFADTGGRTGHEDDLA
jgi:hypothetical protein